MRHLVLTTAVLALVGHGFGQQIPTIGSVLPYSHGVAPRANPSDKTVLIDEHVVHKPGAPWIGLQFADMNLPRGSLLEIRSIRDGDTQVLDHDSMQSASAYFNGEAVLVRLWAGARTADTFYRLQRIAVGHPTAVQPMQTCGPDDRVVNTDKRIGRMIVTTTTGVGVCTGWLFNNRNCFATAGHCFRNVTNVTVQFNVPLSTSNGSMQSPPSSDQYLWTGKYQYRANGPGDDWGVFTTLANPTTRKHAGEAQGAYFRVSTSDDSSTLTPRGYGTDMTPPSRNHVLQTDTGPRKGKSGNQIWFEADAEGGASGGPVIKSNGWVIGVITQKACPVLGFNIAHYCGDSRFVAARNAICQARPDLVITALTISGSPTTLHPNLLYSASSTVRNIGNADSGSFQRTHRLSTNSTITKSDTLLSSLSDTSIAPNLSRTRTASFRVPVSFRPGYCYLGAIADEDGTVLELDETNNTRRGGRLTCANPTPDLTVTSLRSGQTTFTGGALVDISSAVQNRGGAATSRSASVRYLISADSTITNLDKLIASWTLRSLTVNSSQSHSSRVRLPADLTTRSTCYLGVFADAGLQIGEIDESNNTRALARSCVGVADYVVTALQSTATTLAAGGRVGLSATVKNAGGASSRTSTTTGFYLSNDSRITTSDRLLAHWSLGGLTRSASQVVSVTVRMPHDLAPGACYLGAIADSTQKLTEAIETNNTRSLAVRCEAKPDLVVTRFVPSTTNWRPNGSVSISTTIENRGALAASFTSTATFYASRDDVITTSDVFLGDVATRALKKGEKQTIARTLQLPVDLPVGVCWLGVYADRRDGIAESFEDNNTAAARGLCAFGKPDLTVTSLTAPATLQSGARLAVTSTTKNTGEGPSPRSRSAIVLSDDQSITTSDTLLGAHDVPTLAINATSTSTESYLVPYCESSRGCWIGAIADAGATVSEISETNNTRSLPRNCRAYTGTRELLEYVPRLGSAATTTDSATFALTSGPRDAQMCITARQASGELYVIVWSARSQFAVDGLTGFTLSLLNSSFFRSWLGTIDGNGYGRAPSLNLVVPPQSRLTVWNHLFLFDSNGQARLANGGPIQAFIDP